MGFVSYWFLLLFLPAVVAANWGLLAAGRTADRKRFLLAASLMFYALASLETLPILLGSLGMNHFVAQRIQSAGYGSLRRRWLTLGIVINVALLAVFKYAHFLVDNLGGLVGWQLDLPAFALPLGISFFTIQQIIYLVDCYEELVSPAPLLEHAVFISFFPYITAGPIARAGNIIPQLESRDPPGEQKLATGLMLFAIGLCKKVGLADTFGLFADAGFSAEAPLGMKEGWLTAVSFTFQLYFDFSGYSDMAVGIGLMLGLSLPVNFNSPLKAVSIIDFWKRWHITLSNFITTYLYTPMARSMRPLTFGKAMLVTVLAMAIAGLWHGAAWTFVFFGLWHGLGLVLNHMWRKSRIKLPQPLAWGMTFVFVVVSLVMFRAAGWSQASAVFASMAGMHGLGGGLAFAEIPYLAESLLIMIAGAAVALTAPNSNQVAQAFRPSWRWSIACAAALVTAILLFNDSASSGFIYRAF